MATNALYNVYRPRNFESIIGQKHISEVLKNQVANDQIAHAYMFSGTRGTGKTSTAKVLAKAVNCLHPKNGEPCGECEMCKKIEKGLCIDVVEMDAASKRKLEDMRGIIDTLKYPPQDAKYKVYILDEVHMLTNEAVNAFLKSLEEPPKNVIFILATTDPQKLPVTILSRCQKYEFRRINPNDILGRLKYVCKESDIKIEDEALKLIAKVADGAMRDSLSLLDEVKSISSDGSAISYKQVLNILGAASKKDMFDISSNILTNSTIGALNIIQELDDEGKDFNLYIKDLMKFMRDILMSKIIATPEAVIPMANEDVEKLKEIALTTSKEKIISAIKILQDTEITMRNSSQIRVLLELAVIQITGLSASSENTTPVIEKPQIEPEDKHEDNSEKPNNKQEVEHLPTKDITKKVKESKIFVINTLKNNQNHQLKELGAALERAKMKLSPNFEIKILPVGNEDKKIVSIQHTAIERGFTSFLSKQNISVNILIE